MTVRLSRQATWYGATITLGAVIVTVGLVRSDIATLTIGVGLLGSPGISDVASNKKESP